MRLKDTKHVSAAKCCLLVDLMPGWVVHEVTHRYLVLGLEDLDYLMAALRHFDVDRLFLSFERHGLSWDEDIRERERAPR